MLGRLVTINTLANVMSAVRFLGTLQSRRNRMGISADRFDLLIVRTIQFDPSSEHLSVLLKSHQEVKMMTPEWKKKRSEAAKKHTNRISMRNPVSVADSTNNLSWPAPYCPPKEF